MAVPNLLRVVLHWSGYGEEGTLSWHVGGLTGTHDSTALGQMLSAVEDAWTNNETPSVKTQMRSLLSSSQTFDRLDAYQYATSAGPATSQGSSDLSGWTGNGNNMPAPLPTALVATLLTDTPGASFRGRQYWPAHTQSIAPSTALFPNAVSDLIANVAVNAGFDLADAVGSSLSENGARWVVYSRVRGVGTEVKHVRVDNRPDVQRRRENSLLPTYSAVLPS